MCKVSIIVPVYNVEDYIKECLDSLISQTFTDIEIILVDDGSKDCSGAICDEYAKGDARIRVYHRNNEGASAARRFGVEKAEGNYISFVDSDDYVEKSFIAEMYGNIAKYDADLAECDYTIFSSRFMRRKSLYEEALVAEKTEFLQNIVKHTIINGDVAVVMWNKLYRRKLILELVKEYGNSLLEDYIFNIQYYTGVEKYVYINKALINYRQLQNSLSKRYNPCTYMILKDISKLKADFMKQTGLDDAECIELSYQWYVKYVYNFLKNMFVMKNGLTTKEKKTEAMAVLRDEELRQICENMQEKNDFSRNINENKYDVVIKKLIIVGIKEKIKHVLSKVKKLLIRSKG